MLDEQTKYDRALSLQRLFKNEVEVNKTEFLTKSNMYKITAGNTTVLLTVEDGKKMFPHALVVEE